MHHSECARHSCCTIKYFRKVYEGNKQYSLKDELWEAVKVACARVSKSEILALIMSMDARLLKLIEKKRATLTCDADNTAITN